MMKCSLSVLLLAVFFWCSSVKVKAQIQCQSDADCLHNGSCQQPDSSRSYCQCPNGFGGDDCSATCLKDCQNGGSCRYTQDVSHGSDQDGNAYCECEGTFVGVNCEIPFTLCGSGSNVVRCLHGGICEKKKSGEFYGCQCPTPRTGDMCQYTSQDDDPHGNMSVVAQSSSQNNASSDQDNFNKALAMMLGAIAVAGIVTLGAMLEFRRTKKGSGETRLEHESEAC
jgi:hypothetical protein